MTTKADRVRRDIENHQHEGWQLQVSAQGGWYCAACGRPVDNVEAQRLGNPPLGPAVELATVMDSDG